MRQKGANVADNSNKPTSECSTGDKLNLLFVSILNNTYATVTFQLFRQKPS